MSGHGETNPIIDGREIGEVGTEGRKLRPSIPRLTWDNLQR